jgi:hypothetical protein
MDGRDLAAERQDAQLVALSARRLRDKNRKAKQREKKKERESRKENASQLKIQLKAAEASRGPYVEPIWSRRGPVARRDSLLVKITSDEETMLAVATLIWRWDRATGWEKIQVDIPGDEETMVKPDLSTKEGRSEYNRTNYNKRKAAGKVGGETATKRPYNRTHFPKREPGNQGELDAPQNAASEDQNEEDISHTVPLAVPGDTTEETPLAASEDTKEEDKDISHSVPKAASMPWGGVSWGGMMGSAMELDAPQNAAAEDQNEEDIPHTVPLAVSEDTTAKDISHTVLLAASEDKNEQDISHSVPIAASTLTTATTPEATSPTSTTPKAITTTSSTTPEATTPGVRPFLPKRKYHERPTLDESVKAAAKPREEQTAKEKYAADALPILQNSKDVADLEVDGKWLEPCTEADVKWLEFCKELDAKAAKTAMSN